MTYDDVMRELYSLADEKFRAFTVRLLRCRREVAGVRTPALRRLGKRIKKEFPGFVEEFFARPSVTHEEVLLAGWQTGRDYDANVRLFSRLIPIMDSWAQTDQTITAFDWAPDKEKLISDLGFLLDGGEYEKRAYVMLLMTNCMTADTFYITERELPRVRFGEYYVDMMRAWYFATALAKRWDDAFPYLQGGALDPWTRRAAIRKALESYRITPAQKDCLRALRASLQGTSAPQP